MFGFLAKLWPCVCVCVCFVILFPPSVFADGVATTEIHVGHKKNRLNTSLQMAMAKAPT